MIWCGCVEFVGTACLASCFSSAAEEAAEDEKGCVVRSGAGREECGAVSDGVGVSWSAVYGSCERRQQWQWVLDVRLGLVRDGQRRPARARPRRARDRPHRAAAAVQWVLGVRLGLVRDGLRTVRVGQR